MRWQNPCYVPGGWESRELENFLCHFWRYPGKAGVKRNLQGPIQIHPDWMKQEFLLLVIVAELLISLRFCGSFKTIITETHKQVLWFNYLCVEEWDWVSKAGRVVLIGVSCWYWYLLLTLGPSNCPVKHCPFPPLGPLSPFWGEKEKKKFFLPLFSRISFWALFQIIFRVKCICFLSFSSPTMLSLNHRWGVGGTAQANSSLGPRVFSTFPYILPQRGCGHLTSVIYTCGSNSLCYDLLP